VCHNCVKKGTTRIRENKEQNQVSTEDSSKLKYLDSGNKQWTKIASFLSTYQRYRKRRKRPIKKSLEDYAA